MRRNRRLSLGAGVVLASYLPGVLVQAAVVLPRDIAGSLLLTALRSFRYGIREGNRNKLTMLWLAVLSVISAGYISPQDLEAGACAHVPGG